MKKYKMTSDGYNKKIQELDKLKKDFRLNEIAMSKSYQSASGDGAHDNAEFEYLLANERMLANLINDLTTMINNTEIIEIGEVPDDIVNVNDVVSLNLLFAKDDKEFITIRLVGGTSEKDDEVSLNSPLGKAIYRKKIGDVAMYTVNDKKINVEIVSIENRTEKLKRLR